MSSGPRIGELFAGYGGLGMGVQAVFGGEVAWYSEIDKGALKILEHRFPDVPNVGNVTTADWAQVEPVDILTGGSPCQDLSHAGKRAGMTEGTRSNLWVAMREAIAQLRPGLVVWENVRGAASAEADSDLELCPGCMGDPGLRGPVLRALGRVVGDLAELGYVGRVHGVRASDVGAPHGRFRYFAVAEDAAGMRGREGDCHRVGLASFRAGSAAVPVRADRGSDSAGLSLWSGGAEDGEALVSDGLAGSVLPLVDLDEGAQVGDGFGAECDGHGSTEPGPAALVNTAVPTNFQLLPTPAVNDMGAGKTPDDWDVWTERMKAEHGNGNGHGKSLAIEAQRLPCCKTCGGIYGAQCPPHIRSHWGEYTTAIARWEHILGREAPAPTQTSSKGNPQLSPAFVEWMMGLPAGWVTDVPDITRNEALKALGNGVVPQQAAAALRTMLAWDVAA